MRTHVLMVVATLAVAGCKSGGAGGQSFHDGVAALCALPDHVPAPNADSYEKRVAAVNAWAEQHVTNPDARKLGGPVGGSLVDAVAKGKAELAAAVEKTGVKPCKLLDYDMALQSFAEAMTLACAMPADPGQAATYMKTHLLNPEVVTMIESLGNADPADRAKVIGEAVTRAGLASCPFADQIQAHAGQMPELTGPGLVELDPKAPTLVITPDAIVVDGKAIVAVRDGQIDPAELEGGAFGMNIPRLTAFLTTYGDLLAKKATAPGRPPLALVVAPTTPYHLLMQVVFTSGQAGFRRFALVVHAPDGNRAIPVALPEHLPTGGALTVKPGTAPEHLGMIVSVTTDRVILWSVSGTEGSLKKPALDVPITGSVEALRPALAAIVARRWKTAKRTDADRTIVLMADAAIPMQTVAALLAGVRADDDGAELFPDVLLSAGIQ